MRPTPDELIAAQRKILPDLMAVGMKAWFIGINPSLYSAAVGHHFARPGNRFWPALYAAGFTKRLLAPGEQRELLAAGYGITNVVARATVGAAELKSEEYVAGARLLERKAKRYRPGTLAFLGIGAYRAAYGRPKAVLGEQAERIGGAAVWVLPNPSGLNAHFTPPALAKLFREFRLALEGGGG